MRRVSELQHVIVIVGTGDHARVAADLARACGVQPVAFLLPIAAPGVVADLDGLPVIERDSPAFAGVRASGASFVVGMGHSGRRATEFAWAMGAGLEPKALVHPSATLLSGVVIGPGAQVCARAILGLNVQIDADVIVNTGASLDHDCHIGEHATVAPGVNLAGRVTVGSGAEVGIGATVIQGISIGVGALVAAGATVIRDVPDGGRVAGVPARAMASREERSDDTRR